MGSYEPFRQHNGDALNEQYRLLDETRAPTSLETLEAVVARACKGDADLLAMNIPIAQATYAYAVENSISAHREDVRRIVMPFGHAYDFGMPMLMEYADGRMAAVFSDLRRTQALTRVGRRFVFAAMHHRWRENYPDLAEVDLEIWRYVANDSRTVQPTSQNGIDLIPYDTIVSDVRETYEIWHNVVEQAGLARRGTANDAGPLFARR